MHPEGGQNIGSPHANVTHFRPTILTVKWDGQKDEKQPSVWRPLGLRAESVLQHGGVVLIVHCSSAGGVI